MKMVIMSLRALRSWKLTIACCASALTPIAAACGDDSSNDQDIDAAVEEEGEVGTPSGAICPTDNTLTYGNFGKQFVEDYCVRCHSSELTGEKRSGAPQFHDFDSLEGILNVANHVDEMAAAGPDSINTSMPPNGAKPTMAEREKFGQWLQCELDKQ